jgi:hypothetical protein
VPAKPAGEDVESGLCVAGRGAISWETAANANQLWRIEGSLSAVRSEVHKLRQLDDPSLRARVALIERDWRSELERALPSSLAGEFHALLDWLGMDDASAAELRLGLAQLEGWVDGLLSGMGIVIVHVEEARPIACDDFLAGSD